MTIYTCVPEWEAMLTCIYEAWKSGKGHENIMLLLEPVEQLTLFDEYIHVDASPEKAEKVADAVIRKISLQFYENLAYTSMAYEEEVLDNIYRVMILGFAYGPNVIDMVQYKDIMRNCQIRKRVGTEANHFREFIRFHAIGNSVFVAHIEPKSRILPALGPDFLDRMPSEHWVIVDDVHSEAVIHPKDRPFFFRTLSKEELNELKQTEEQNDEYTGLWKTFFNSIAIEQRKNPKCQRNLFPVWTRKHAVEFM